MDTNIKTLSDDELMEVTGGASSSGFNCLNISSESECKNKEICRWNTDKKRCENIDWLIFTKL
jgi:bacteriocin-like protein